MTSDAGGRSAARRLELVTDLADELRAALADGDRALNSDGDLQESRRRFERAYQLAEQTSDVPAMAVAALGLAGLWVSERRTVTGSALLEARLQQVLARLDQGSSLALRIRARLAAEADYVRGAHAGILAVLAEARAADDAVALAEALSLAHHCLLGPDDVTLRRELALELVKVSFRTERRGDRLMGLLWQTVDSYSDGDLHAGRSLSELRVHLGQHDHSAVAFVLSAIEVMLAIRAGHLDDAESLVDICAKNGVKAGDIDSEWWPGAQLVTIRWYQERLVELLPMLHERVHSPALSAVDNSAVAALAVAAALDGDRRTAASCLAALRGADLAMLPRSSSWLVTMNGIVEAAYLLEDSDLASQAYALLRPYGRLPMVGGLCVTCFGTTQQALGVAALTSRHLDTAIDHLRAAVQHNLALAHWPAVASSRQRLARAYELRAHPGDADAAKRELDAARGEATGLPVPGRRFPASSSGTAAECDRVGRQWRLTLHDRSVLVADSIGMLHLAVLIASPRQEIPATDLVAGMAVLSSAARGGSPHPLLDHAAIAEYRSRVKQLDAQIGELESGSHSDQAARARAERDWLLAQLANAAGLGGRARTFSDEGERARVAVGKAIRRALARVTEADAVIGAHLRQTVHTGMRCSYWPG
ncbi:MAG: hypothetical protein ACLQFR_04780 [Streptosporangiaceae bacterium]